MIKLEIVIIERAPERLNVTCDSTDETGLTPIELGFADLLRGVLTKLIGEVSEPSEEERVQ